MNYCYVHIRGSFPPPKFIEISYAIADKITKFGNVFSLEGFPYYYINKILLIILLQAGEITSPIGN